MVRSWCTWLGVALVASTCVHVILHHVIMHFLVS